MEHTPASAGLAAGDASVNLTNKDPCPCGHNVEGDAPWMCRLWRVLPREAHRREDGVVRGAEPAEANPSRSMSIQVVKRFLTHLAGDKEGRKAGRLPREGNITHVVEEGPPVEGFPSVCGGGGWTACWKKDSDVGQ